MINIRQTLLTLFILVSCTISNAQKPILAPAPNWVKVITPDLAAKIDENEAEGGVAYLLIDLQENISEQASYYHFVYKILNSNGSQSMSDVGVSLDPSFQKVFFHNLVIHRNGNTIDVLKMHQFESIRRETDKERYLYDGTITNIINIKDVREGDILEFSYTYKGYNPLKKGKFSDRQYFNYSVPIHQQYYAITAPSNRKLNFWHAENSPQPQESKVGQNNVYVWDLKNAKPLLLENNVPSWYNPYKQVYISEYNSWEDIVNWSLPLYETQPQELSNLKKLYGEKIDSTDFLSITKAIRFVQDEVRYLGFESGMGSYRPHRPEQVFKNRFGDCKDKSLLLVSLLRSAGIKAYPMLVNTSKTSELGSEGICSPDMFDHCVVNISLDGKEYYIDPTLNYQGNTLGKIYFPRYYYGLVIRKGETTLRSINPSRVPTILINEVYTINAIGGSTDYKITSEYNHAQADYQRALFKGSSNESISKSYMEFYGKLYPKIKQKEKLRFNDKDRDNANIFTITENYTIDNLWKKNSEDTAQLNAEFYSLAIHSYLSTLTSSERTAPYALQEPIRIIQQTKLLLPEPWNITESEFFVNHPSFSFSFSSSSSVGNRIVMLKYEYIIKDDYVSADDYPDFYEKQNQVRDNLTFTLSIGGSDAKTIFRPQLFMILFGFVVLIIAIVAAGRVHARYNPEPVRLSDYMMRYDGIGGWLILLAIGITISPFRICYDIAFTDTFFNRDIWLGTLSEKILSLCIVSFFFALEIVHLIFSILVAIQFYQRRSSLPKLIIILFAYRVVICILAIVVTLLIDDRDSIDENIKAFFQTVVPAAIWIPYFLVSKRVQGTFRKRYNEDEYDYLDTETPPSIPTGKYDSGSL